MKLIELALEAVTVGASVGREEDVLDASRPRTIGGHYASPQGALAGPQIDAEDLGQNVETSSRLLKNDRWRSS